EAHFAHGFLHSLHFCSRRYAAVCSGKRRCAKRERDRTARAPNRPTTQPTGPRRRCHATNVRLFTPRDKQKTANLSPSSAPALSSALLAPCSLLRRRTSSPHHGGRAVASALLSIIDNE